jgi:hypothetical protein
LAVVVIPNIYRATLIYSTTLDVAITSKIRIVVGVLAGLGNEDLLERYALGCCDRIRVLAGQAGSSLLAA